MFFLCSSGSKPEIGMLDHAFRVEVSKIRVKNTVISLYGPLTGKIAIKNITISAGLTKKRLGLLFNSKKYRYLPSIPSSPQNSDILYR